MKSIIIFIFLILFSNTLLFSQNSEKKLKSIDEKNSNNSRLILLPRYSHGIHQQDPKIVAEARLGIYENALSAIKIDKKINQK